MDPEEIRRRFREMEEEEEEAKRNPLQWVPDPAGRCNHDGALEVLRDGNSWRCTRCGTSYQHRTPLSQTPEFLWFVIAALAGIVLLVLIGS